MEPRSIQFVQEAAGARLLSGDASASVARITTDSRRVQPGDLFVALSGDKFDGHRFIADAVRDGAAAVLVEAGKVSGLAALPPTVAVLAVDDTRVALGRWAARYRADFDLPRVAVGGSNGKTTTKELVASVLRQRYRVCWSEASFNNDVGVPLTLLRLAATDQAAVFEVGTNHPGELAPLLNMIQPQLGIITSIGREHLEFFRDLEGVVQEEGAVAECLPPDGRLFIPGDSPWADRLASRARCPVVRVGGPAPGNQWRGRIVRCDDAGTEFDVEAPGGRHSGRYRVGLLGQHQVTNALFALGVGDALGLTSDELRQGLRECAPPKMRLQLSKVGAVRVIDDSYNANADSVLAALKTLAALPCSGRRIAVLGDMAELGEQARPAHEEIGRASADLNVDCLVAVGRWAEVTADAATRAGLRRVVACADVAAAVAQVPPLLEAGDTVLLKASRSTGLERVVAAIRTLTAPAAAEVHDA